MSIFSYRKFRTDSIELQVVYLFFTGCQWKIYLNGGHLIIETRKDMHTCDAIQQKNVRY